MPLTLTSLAVCLLSTTFLAADDTKPSKEIPITECLSLSGVGRGGRRPVSADPVAALVVSGRWAAPSEGGEVVSADGTRTKWKKAKAGDDGTFQGPGFSGGYAFANVPSESEQVMILEATGHAMVAVNGEGRAGDPYGYGYVKVPVLLHKGYNAFLFRTGRGRLKAKLVQPRAKAQIETGDPTVPDMIIGEPVETWGAVIVVNSTNSSMSGLTLSATLPDGPKTTTKLPALAPLSIRKVGFKIAGQAQGGEGDRKLALVLEKDGVLDKSEVTMRVRKPESTQKRTFLSAIDGSVQYYGLVPAKASGDTAAPKPGLILSLHGASVEGIGQAAVYTPKDWAHVVAPTNRRPYGFDWEDWGRLDAIEVLELARAQLQTDPRRTWLTGHSMGGHGAWHLGVTFPDKFAAVAPSAGWVSMMSYAGARPMEGTVGVEGLLTRATAPSDTLALAENLAKVGVYILHGSADDNVPVVQARQMRTRLAEFHPDFTYYERPGAGHWWGSECCDWPPLVEFLRAREIPNQQDISAVDFLTFSPGGIRYVPLGDDRVQIRSFKPSRIHLKYDKAKGGGKFSGTTENVARLSLDLSRLPAGNFEVTLDGKTLSNLEIRDARLWFHRDSGTWSAIEKPSPELKGPKRSGPFKDAFRNHVLFVYGTHGTPEENAWALAKARYDGERFWYQGNASVDLVPDTAFDPANEPDRNVVLYGHAELNSAWSELLANSPVQVSRGKMVVGERTKTGEDLACLFVRPRPGSDIATVGVVSGTGMAGLRLAGTPAYFTSGVGYPDCLVLGPETLTKGIGGVISAGYFGEDWSVRTGEFAWRD